MRKLSLLIVLLVVFNSLSCSPSRTGSDFEIKFGFMRQDAKGIFYVYKETREIPKILENTGFRYGYTIKNTKDSNFIVFLILYPPSPVKIYKFRDEFKNESRVEAGGPVIRTKPVEVTGKASASFSFDKSDPLGIWKLEIYVNDKLIRTINFSVVSSPDVT